MTQGKHILILLFPSVEDTLLNYLTPPVLNTLQEIFLNKNDNYGAKKIFDIPFRYIIQQDIFNFL